HVDQWPMDDIDDEVLAEIEHLLSPTGLDIELLIAKAREKFEADAKPDRQEALRRQLAAADQAQTRFAEAIATRGGIPALATRLHEAEATRRAVLAELQQTHQRRPAPSWAAMERGLRQKLADWRSLITSRSIPKIRPAFRKMFTAPILLTPFIDRGYRAV